MASTEINFIPDFDELDRQIQDEDFETEIDADVQADGGAGGGGIVDALGLAEIGSDIGTGGGQGAGIFGSIAGSLSSVTLLLGAVVGFLALLEPIQKAVGFIVRQFELFVTPLVSALLPVLELLQEASVQLIRLFRNPDQFLSGLVNNIKRALAPLVNSIISGLNGLPGVNIQPVSTGQGDIRETGFRDTGEKQQNDLSRALTGSPLLRTLDDIDNYLLSDDGKKEKQSSRIEGQNRESNP